VVLINKFVTYVPEDYSSHGLDQRRILGPRRQSGKLSIKNLFSVYPETVFSDVILRSKATKNLIVGGAVEILRRACPELAEGLRMTLGSFRISIS